MLQAPNGSLEIDPGSRWRSLSLGKRPIIEVAKKIPDNVLREDPKLRRWYDQALTRSGME